MVGSEGRVPLTACRLAEVASSCSATSGNGMAGALVPPPDTALVEPASAALRRASGAVLIQSSVRTMPGLKAQLVVRKDLLFIVPCSARIRWQEHTVGSLNRQMAPGTQQPMRMVSPAACGAVEGC